MLRVLPEAAPKTDPFAQPRPLETHRMVYFVGNLLGDTNTGGLTMDQVVKTILDVWPNELGNAQQIVQFHKDAQLVVANGTHEQLDFIQQTLQALNKKASTGRAQESDLMDLEELGRVLQKEPFSNILKSIFNSGSK